MAYVKTNSYKPNRESLTEEQKKQIKIMFFGPYEKSWYTSNGIVDNSDLSISKRLGVGWHAVSNYTNNLANGHFKMIAKQRMHFDYELPKHLKTKF